MLFLNTILLLGALGIRVLEQAVVQAHLYWHGVLGRVRDGWIARTPDLPNLALGRPATQSSVCEWSRAQTIAADAAGILAGALAGARIMRRSEGSEQS